MQGAAKVPKLASAAETRWGSIKKSLETADKSCYLLWSVVGARNFTTGVAAKQRQKRTAIATFIRTADFQRNLKLGIKLLSPIDELIVKYQNDKIAISEIYPDFLALISRYRTSPDIDSLQRDFLVSTIKFYWEFLRADVHLIAYLLDPRYIGEKLDRTDRASVERMVVTYAFVVEGDILVELDNFMEHAQSDKDSNNAEYCLYFAEENPRKPKGWWLKYGHYYPSLKPFAMKIFSL